MRINSIELINFRSHKNSKFNFTEGINLILGNNGDGKSSILEAIELCLFNKNGNKKDITKGEKQAKILLEIKGNDGIAYLITKYIPSSNKNKVISLDNNMEIKDFYEKSKTIIGIGIKNKDLFQNIVIAKQNEFTNVFKKTNKDRITNFDKIFETEIYRTMDTGFLSNAKKKYDNELITLNTKQETKSLNMNNKEEEEEKIKNEREKLEVLKKEKVAKDKEIEVLNKEIEKYNKLNTSIENRANIIETLSQDKITFKENLKKAIKAAKESKKAKKMVEATKENYNIYEVKSEKYNNLFSISTKFTELNTNIKNSKNNLATYEKEKNNSIKNIEENKIKIDSYNLDLEKSNDLLKKLESLKNEIDDDKITKINALIVSSGDNIKAKQKEIDSLNNYNFTNEELKNFFESELEKIKNQKTLKTEKEKSCEILKSNLKDVKYFENKLNEKLCPIFSENCQNLEDRNIDNFFVERKNDLENGIKVYENEISKLNKLVSREEEYEKNLNKLNNLIFNMEEEKKKIKNYNKDLEPLILIRDNNEAEILKKLKENNYDDIKALESFITNTEKDRDIISKSNETIEKDLKKKVDSIINEEENLKEFEEQKNKLNIDNIQNLEDEIEKLKIDLTKLKPDRDAYIKNLGSADNFEENYDSFKDKCEQLRDKRKEYKNKYEELDNDKKELKNYNIQELSSVLKIKNDELQNINTEIGASESNIKNLEETIKQIIQQQKEIDDLLEDIKKINFKIKLIEELRKNISNMGPEISSMILKNISAKASINFNRITARSEKIEWINRDNENYLVTLKDKKNEYEFTQLSGGEQIAVAISLRSAMFQSLTNTKIFILDEPTNNLDTERKELLSNYMGEMLIDLDQTLIISHDDVFSHIAQNIIRVKKYEN